MSAMNQRNSKRITQSPRSVAIGNHRTSVRLESAMWDALHEIAAALGMTVHDLIAEIDRNHTQASLSSAIRVYIVEHYRGEVLNRA